MFYCSTWRFILVSRVYTYARRPTRVSCGHLVHLLGTSSEISATRPHIVAAVQHHVTHLRKHWNRTTTTKKCSSNSSVNNVYDEEISAAMQRKVPPVLQSRAERRLPQPFWFLLTCSFCPRRISASLKEMSSLKWRMSGMPCSLSLKKADAWGSSCVSYLLRPWSRSSALLKGNESVTSPTTTAATSVQYHLCARAQTPLFLRALTHQAVECH